jgi:hypothetical protein
VVHFSLPDSGAVLGARRQHYEHISALGTDSERFTDRKTVAAWEKVEKALKR